MWKILEWQNFYNSPGGNSHITRLAGLFRLFLLSAVSGNGVFDGLYGKSFCIIFEIDPGSRHHDLFKRPVGLSRNAWEESLSIRELEKRL